MSCSFYVNSKNILYFVPILRNIDRILYDTGMVIANKTLLEN